jgi:hypothetical protein
MNSRMLWRSQLSRFLAVLLGDATLLPFAHLQHSESNRIITLSGFPGPFLEIALVKSLQLAAQRLTRKCCQRD